MVRLERVELSMGKPTWPSTKPVYQFQHSRLMRHNKTMTINLQVDRFYLWK